MQPDVAGRPIETLCAANPGTEDRDSETISVLLTVRRR
jgi:hypothetical protein